MPSPESKKGLVKILAEALFGLEAEFSAAWAASARSGRTWSRRVINPALTQGKTC